MLEKVFLSFKYLFIDNFPSLDLIVWGLPVSFLYGLGVLFIAGFLKRNFFIRTGLTRKFFHFFIFFSATLIQVCVDLSATLVFGGGISLVVLFSLLKGDGNVFYEALARESDEPVRARYIILPYFATLLGGLTVNLLFSPIHSLAGYLITGIGDAIGEPVGVKWGKHKYRVTSFTNQVSYRSLEGSMAVFLSVLIVFVLIAVFNNVVFANYLFIKIVFASLLVTITEAISPHGWDNYTTMLVGGLLSYLIF